VLLDADLGLANIDVLLGLETKRNLQDVLNGDCDLRDVLVDGPGASRLCRPHQHPAHDPAQCYGARRADSRLQRHRRPDRHTDCGYGAASPNRVVSFLRASQELLLVVCDEPTSITDATP